MKIKAIFASMFMAGIGISIGFVKIANATLFVTGEVNYAGEKHNLIYDNDLNITWLDYTNNQGIWQYQMDWAQNLIVTTASGQILDDWRLPLTLDDSLIVDIMVDTRG